MNKKMVIAIVTVACISAVAIFLVLQFKKNSDDTTVGNYTGVEDNQNPNDDDNSSGSPPTTDTDGQTPKHILVINNVDANDESLSLSGAVIRITNKNDDTFSEVMIPDGGMLQQELPEGDYLIEEVTPASDYSPSDNIENISLDVNSGNPVYLTLKNFKIGEDATLPDDTFDNPLDSSTDLAALDNPTPGSNIDNVLAPDDSSNDDVELGFENIDTPPNPDTSNQEDDPFFDPEDDSDILDDTESQGSINENDDFVSPIYGDDEGDASVIDDIDNTDETSESEATSLPVTDNPKTADNPTIFRAVILTLILINVGLVYIFFLYKNKYKYM